MSTLIKILTEQTPHIHADYFCHFYAGSSGDEDQVYDISGAGNHGTFGANLSAPWANAGYVSSENPGAGTEDACIRFPNFNLDYAGRESMILWWLGKATAEGSNVNAIGDGFNTTYHGLNIRVTATTGTFTLSLSDGTSTYFGATSTSTPFTGGLHSVGIVLDGGNKEYAYWVDDALDAATSGGYTSYSSGTSIDTQNAVTFNIGSSLPASATSQIGMVMQTRAFVLLKLGAGRAVPTTAQITSIFEQLRANPSRPLLQRAYD